MARIFVLTDELTFNNPPMLPVVPKKPAPLVVIPPSAVPNMF